MKVVRVTINNVSEVHQLTALVTERGGVARSFSVPDDFYLVAGLELVVPNETPKEKKEWRRGPPTPKVEVAFGLEEKLKLYVGNDPFILSVRDAWKKYGRLSANQIVWLEKKLGAS